MMISLYMYPYILTAIFLVDLG